jgi:carbamoylphosphate synthase small subunit
MITINKITKNELNFSSAVIGNNIRFAAIKQVKVKEVALNDRETAVIINKATDNLTVSFEPDSLPVEQDGALFDEEKKAQVIAKGINISNSEKLQALESEIAEAKSFLRELIEKGA